MASILTAAAQVFGEESYGATTDRIAVRAGVSVGSLYQYFPNKDALLLALARRHLEEATDTLTGILVPGRSSAQWLPDLVVTMLALHADGELHRVLVDQAPRTPELVAAFDAAERAATRAIEQLLSSEFVMPDAEATARVLAALIESLTHRLVGRLAPDVLLTEVERAASAYLGAATGNDVVIGVPAGPRRIRGPRGPRPDTARTTRGG